MSGRDDLPYRPCAGAMILNAEGLVFVGRRRGGPENVDRNYEWQMPQGGIDKGEDPFEAAVREVFEETSIRSVTLLAEAPEWFSYDIPDEIAGKGWTKKYRGQTQKWFAFRFTGPDSEIDIASPGGGRHKPEFEAWRWERMERLPELIVPFKRPVYERVVKAFRPLAE
jgi:putative (di)nucleoside polyphosphate hydrolase